MPTITFFLGENTYSYFIPLLTGSKTPTDGSLPYISEHEHQRKYSAQGLLLYIKGEKNYVILQNINPLL